MRGSTGVGWTHGGPEPPRPARGISMFAASRKHLPAFLAGVGGVLVGATLLGGAAYAANGGSFLLGRSNTETATAALTNTAGSPLSLVAKAGYAPLRVNT